MKTMEHDIARQEKEISHLKQVDRKRLNEKQKIFKIGFDERMRNKEDRLFREVRDKKSELQNSERIRMKKTLEEANQKSNERINWVRNSLRSYSQRE